MTRFPRRVFVDVEGIEAGRDFEDSIDAAIRSCRVLLVVIGVDWVTTADSSGRRRLDDTEDVVRREIAAALRHNLAVIPVLVGGAVMPAASSLPADVVELARRQAVRIGDEDFRRDVGELIRVVRSEIGVDIPSIVRNRWLIGGLVALLLAVGWGLWPDPLSRLAGRWEPIGKMGIYRGYRVVTAIDFRVDGNAVHGAVSTLGGDGERPESYEIRDGNVTGDSVSFAIVRNKEEGRFYGRLVNDTLELTFTDDIGPYDPEKLTRVGP